ncbi:hypothetical protein HDU93_003606, partial [Gonapodya sp. JEL0774]
MSNPLGGTVKVHYWLAPISRGNNVRLLLADLDIPYENIDAGARTEWPTKFKKEVIALQKNLGTVPIVTLPDGRVIGEHLAAMRYIARKAAPSYYPTEDLDKALVVDTLLDVNQDWRVQRRLE